MSSDAASKGGNGGTDGFGSDNIGNYKGVMLCNRPNEPGQLPTRDR